MGQQLSSGHKLPYKKGNRVWQHLPNQEFKLELYDGEEYTSNLPVSIFSIQPTHSTLASNYFKRIKTIKHPNLLSLINGTMVENEMSYYIVTEKVTPLRQKLNRLLSYPDSIAWGVYQIARAVAFLNDLGLVHGNINIDNIFVNSQGDWKLAGFQMITEISDVVNGTSFYSHSSCRSTTLNIQWPPEIESVFSLFNDQDIGDIHSFERNRLKNTTNLPVDIRKDYVKLLRGSGKQRMPAKEFLDSAYFDKSLVMVCLFLETLSIKEQFEKNRFIKELNELISEFPKVYVTQKILPSLISALDYGMVDSDYLSVILKILKGTKNDDPKLPSSIIKWWSFNDRNIRMLLLENIETLLEYLTEKESSESVWPHYITGFMDTNCQLRDMTIKSLISYAPKLSSKILNDDMLKFLAKAQSDDEPGIRTNTTICIGKICPFIKEATRKKIIVPAYGKTLNDTYPPARMAGINGFKAALTSNFLQPIEVATKIIPLISPLSLDKEEAVREAALDTLQSMIDFLKEHGETMDASKKEEV